MKDLFCHNFGKMGTNVNTKWLQRACAAEEVTRQCALPTELTISFSFCKKALPHWVTCTIALTAAQRRTWVTILQDSSTFPYTKTVYTNLALTLSNWAQSCTWKNTFQ